MCIDFETHRAHREATDMVSCLKHPESTTVRSMGFRKSCGIYYILQMIYEIGCLWSKREKTVSLEKDTHI